MQRKKNEQELGAMMRRYGFHARKSRDRGYISCPNCHMPLKICPKCHKDFLLNKAETLPDYIISFDYVFIEGKGSTDSWSWKSSITPTQDIVCLQHESWLFLEMGTGRAPNGRSAWLVPWLKWKEIQHNLEELNFASIIYEATPRSRNPVASSVLMGYECEWYRGCWKVPDNHVFWATRQEIMKRAMYNMMNEEKNDRPVTISSNNPFED